MEPGTRLSLSDDSFLQPIADDAAAAPQDFVVLLVEGYVAFADGEIARMSTPADDLELFDGLLLVPQEVLDARSPAAGRERQRWAQQIYRDYIAGQVRQLRTQP